MPGRSAAASSTARSSGVPALPETLVDSPELLKKFGITRVGDITGLDVIGVPVWFAARPNSRGLSVAQGKGLTIRQAKLSAVMEAIEGAVAEDVRRHVRHHGSWQQMKARDLNLVPLDTLSRVDVSLFDVNRERAWVTGFSVKTGAEVLAPYELVGLDFRADFPWDRQALHMGSQGLAAGFDFDRAVLHGLLELVENDAGFAVDALDTRGAALRTITFSKGENAALDDLLARLADLGIKPRLFDLTGDSGVPVILASVQRSVIASDGPGERAAGGLACRLDLHDAALAALLEAIQSRLTDISGARDDLVSSRYDADRGSGEWTGARVAPPSVSRIDIDYGALAGPAWRQLAEHLFSKGIDDIHVFSLDSGVPGVVVVRVLANGLAIAGGSMSHFSLGALNTFLSQ